MTNEETIEILIDILTDYSGSRRLMPRDYEAIRNAVSELNNELNLAEKYKWHDLQKNPKDLPYEEIICLLVDDCENMNLGYLSAYRTSDVFTGYKGVPIMQPIAWKYVEPFGGEE